MLNWVESDVVTPGEDLAAFVTATVVAADKADAAGPTHALQWVNQRGISAELKPFESRLLGYIWAPKCQSA